MGSSIDFTNRSIKKIGVLTSGGDAPGMNAAIRAVTRTAIFHNLEVVGIFQGYKGMISNNMRQLTSKDVSNIIQQGGTMLKSARCMEFKTPEGRQIAYDNITAMGVDALVVIGGDGTFTGATLFAKEFNFPVVGVPGTIDNDLFGTDFTIGYDTALNTVMECVDKIKDTASSHERLFFIEVMGRDAGFLALNGGVASGVEGVLIPEVPRTIESLIDNIRSGYRKSKNSSIILVAEGDIEGGAFTISKQFEKEFPEYDIRVTVLGHIQRGGSPTASDRILASQLGSAAIEALLDDQKSIMIGINHGKIVHVPFKKAIKENKEVNQISVNLVNTLSI